MPPWRFELKQRNRWSPSASSGYRGSARSHGDLFGEPENHAAKEEQAPHKAVRRGRQDLSRADIIDIFQAYPAENIKDR